MKVLMWEGLLFTAAIGESFLKQVALKSHEKTVGVSIEKYGKWGIGVGSVI